MGLNSCGLGSKCLAIKCYSKPFQKSVQRLNGEWYIFWTIYTSSLLLRVNGRRPVPLLIKRCTNQRCQSSPSHWPELLWSCGANEKRCIGERMRGERENYVAYSVSLGQFLWSPRSHRASSRPSWIPFVRGVSGVPCLSVCVHSPEPEERRIEGEGELIRRRKVL